MPRPDIYFLRPPRNAVAASCAPQARQSRTSRVGSPANVLLRLRESTSAADLSKLDKFGLEPALSQRVATFADDFNAGHAEDSLVRSLLLQYSRRPRAGLRRRRGDDGTTAGRNVTHC